MSSCADSYLVDERPPEPPPPGPGAAGDAGTAKEEYDFFEQPSREYFCPVTFEVLLHPEQTTCCGNQISKEAIARIQRDKKICPICKGPNLTTMPDKFFRRKVRELKVRCSHKKNGCEWVGDLGSYDDHVKKCPKRPWQCEFCDFKSTYDIGNEHLPNCEKRLVPCPNACEVETVPLADVESHLLECPLQLVACELAHAGCNAQVTRRDLPQHMKESVQQHLLSASLLNLQLTRDKIERQNEELKKKDMQLALNDEDLKRKDQKYTEMVKEKDLKYNEMQRKLQQQFARKYEETEVLMTEKNNQITELEKIYDGVVSLKKDLKEFNCTTEKHLMQQDGGIKSVQQHVTMIFMSVVCHDFTLTEFSKHQASTGSGDWYSDPFYSHPGGYCFKLDIETNHIGAWLKLTEGSNDDSLSWPVKFEVRLVMHNQLADHTHHSVTEKVEITRSYRHFRIASPFFPKSGLQRNAGKGTEYLKNDCLNFKLYIRKI